MEGDLKEILQRIERIKAEFQELEKITPDAFGLILQSLSTSELKAA